MISNNSRKPWKLQWFSGVFPQSTMTYFDGAIKFFQNNYKQCKCFPTQNWWILLLKVMEKPKLQRYHKGCTLHRKKGICYTVAKKFVKPATKVMIILCWKRSRTISKISLSKNIGGCCIISVLYTGGKSWYHVYADISKWTKFTAVIGHISEREVLPQPLL